MGGCSSLCNNVRPRYKHYVSGVFKGKIDAFCSFAKSYPTELNRIGGYLLKQLNNRSQQLKTLSIRSAGRLELQKQIEFGMSAWNDLIYWCNPHISKFESFILQSIIVLFAEDASHAMPLHLLAMKTLRHYLPYSLKLSSNEILSFVDSCTSIATNQNSGENVAIDCLKTLSVIFTHLQNNAQFICPDLHRKYHQIISSILLNFDGLNLIFAKDCFGKFCALIDINDLSKMVHALCSILSEKYSWKPTELCFSLLRILSDSSNVEAMMIVEVLVNYIHEKQLNCSMMNAMIVLLQRFSIEIRINKNRNPILNKLVSLLEYTVSDSDLQRNVLDCVQYYVQNISFIDSQSVLLRMLKHLVTSNVKYKELQLKCVLRTIAHRSGKTRVLKQTQNDTLSMILKYHLSFAHSQESNIIDLLHLSMQNMLLIDARSKPIAIGFNEIEWAKHRISSFLLEKANLSQTSQTSISVLTAQETQWVYAVIYVYLENCNIFSEMTLQRIVNTILLVSIAPFEANDCNNNNIDFDSLLRFLDLSQHLPQKRSVAIRVLLYVSEFVTKHNRNSANNYSVFTQIVSETSGMVDINGIMQSLNVSIANCKTEFAVSSILESLLKESDYIDFENDTYSYSFSHKMSPRNHDLNWNFVDELNCNDDFDELNCMESMRALTDYSDFNETTAAYQENIETMNGFRASVTTVDRDKANGKTMADFVDDARALLEMLNMSHLNESDLGSFYLWNESIQSNNRILHSGIANRLDLKEFEIEFCGLKPLEYELDGIDEYSALMCRLNATQSLHAMQSPVKDWEHLREKGKVALNRFKNKTKSTKSIIKKGIKNVKNRCNKLIINTKLQSHDDADADADVDCDVDCDDDDDDDGGVYSLSTDQENSLSKASINTI